MGDALRLAGCFVTAYLLPLPQSLLGFGGGRGDSAGGQRVVRPGSRRGGRARRRAHLSGDERRARGQDMVRGLVLATALACATDPSLRDAAKARWGTAQPDGTWRKEVTRGGMKRMKRMGEADDEALEAEALEGGGSDDGGSE